MILNALGISGFSALVGVVPTWIVIAAGVTLLVILVILIARIVLRMAGHNGGRTIS